MLKQQRQGRAKLGVVARLEQLEGVERLAGVGALEAAPHNRQAGGVAQVKRGPAQAALAEGLEQRAAVAATHAQGDKQPGERDQGEHVGELDAAEAEQARAEQDERPGQAGRQRAHPAVDHGLHQRALRRRDGLVGKLHHVLVYREAQGALHNARDQHEHEDAEDAAEQRAAKRHHASGKRQEDREDGQAAAHTEAAHNAARERHLEQDGEDAGGGHGGANQAGELLGAAKVGQRQVVEDRLHKEVGQLRERDHQQDAAHEAAAQHRADAGRGLGALISLGLVGAKREAADDQALHQKRTAKAGCREDQQVGRADQRGDQQGEQAASDVATLAAGAEQAEEALALAQIEELAGEAPEDQRNQHVNRRVTDHQAHHEGGRAPEAQGHAEGEQRHDQQGERARDQPGERHAALEPQVDQPGDRHNQGSAQKGVGQGRRAEQLEEHAAHGGRAEHAADAEQEAIGQHEAHERAFTCLDLERGAEPGGDGHGFGAPGKHRGVGRSAGRQP